ncbi:hypothetical protein pipiens_019362 [Culex pipiens pipiens]|uniref:Chromo domain-containing protein n=1 Tax=Culex pipiens pipiens TaxID=38569 RepID=A0ABD1DUL7_CULPP
MSNKKTAAAAAASAKNETPVEDEFSVEKILDRRVVNGKAFEDARKKGKESKDESTSRKPGRKSTATDEAAKAPAAKRKSTASEDKKIGFDRGLEPEEILGATDHNGQLMFLMKWKDAANADLVPAKQANVKCPQIVIKFYESRLTWQTSEKKNDAKDDYA